MVNRQPNFLSLMFAPVGFTVVATYPDGFVNNMVVLDYKDQAIDYAKSCDLAYDVVNIMDRPVFTVKQNYPTSAYID